VDESVTTIDPYIEVTFKDGTFAVPGYVADIVANLDPVRFTKAEALAMVGDFLLFDHVRRAGDEVIAKHLREQARR